MCMSGHWKLVHGSALHAEYPSDYTIVFFVHRMFDKFGAHQVPCREEEELYGFGDMGSMISVFMNLYLPPGQKTLPMRKAADALYTWADTVLETTDSNTSNHHDGCQR